MSGRPVNGMSLRETEVVRGCLSKLEREMLNLLKEAEHMVIHKRLKSFSITVVLLRKGNYVRDDGEQYWCELTFHDKDTS